MFARRVHIEDWEVEYLFMPHGYEQDAVFASLKDAGAHKSNLREAEEIMNGIPMVDTGFIFLNVRKRKAVVLIGPSTSPQEMIDTFVHETYHLAVSIAEAYGLDLTGELPAYLIGDLARAFADVIYTFGCDMYDYATGPKR